MHKVTVIESQGVRPDHDRAFHVARAGKGKCDLVLIDLFVNPKGEPFMRAEVGIENLTMVVGGATHACQYQDARLGSTCLALFQCGEWIKVVFQPHDWPFPEEWKIARDEFVKAVLECL